MARSLRRLTAVLICGVLLGACSGGDDDAGGGDAGASGADDAAAPAAPEDGDPRPSPGGGARTRGAGQEKVTLDSGGVERWYLRHVPPAHDGTTPVPVVVDLHGYSEGAEVHATVSGLGPYGDEQGFVTLTPHGQGQGPVPLWDTTPGGPDQLFIEGMLDDVEASLCVAPPRRLRPRPVERSHDDLHAGVRALRSLRRGRARGGRDRRRRLQPRP